MKLKAVSKEEQKHRKEVQRGKLAKRKGGQYEREIAKRFKEAYGVELKRTPQSGGFAKKSEKADDYRGDITIVDTKFMLLLHIECKAHKILSLKQWLKQSISDCPEGRIPIVVFHRHGTSKDYVALYLSDWYNMLGYDTEPYYFNDDFSKSKYSKWNVFKWFDETEKMYSEKPLLILYEYGTEKNNASEYAVVTLEDFLKNVPKDKVIGKRVFK